MLRTGWRYRFLTTQPEILGAVELKFILIADAANMTPTRKLNITGEFNVVVANVMPVVWPLLNVVVRFEGQPNEGINNHRIHLRLLTLTNQVLFDPGELPMEFWGGGQGTPIRSDTIFPLTGLIFPQRGDYLFSVWLDGQYYGAAPLHIRSSGQ
jgi:hypothetical protein